MVGSTFEEAMMSSTLVIDTHHRSSRPRPRPQQSLQQAHSTQSIFCGDGRVVDSRQSTPESGQLQASMPVEFAVRSWSTRCSRLPCWRRRNQRCKLIVTKISLCHSRPEAADCPERGGMWIGIGLGVAVGRQVFWLSKDIGDRPAVWSSGGICTRDTTPADRGQ